MKKFIILIIVVLSSFNLFAQSQEKNNDVAIYKLFPTKNMWTFIKLDTRNGRLWQVQFDVQGNNRFETYLDIIPKVSTGKEIYGRFNLYPTQNNYTFILLDQIDGDTWQVQWSMKHEDRFVVKIVNLVKLIDD